MREESMENTYFAQTVKTRKTDNSQRCILVKIRRLGGSPDGAASPQDSPGVGPAFKREQKRRKHTQPNTTHELYI